jgi:hypothetical protein
VCPTLQAATRIKTQLIRPFGTMAASVVTDTAFNFKLTQAGGGVLMRECRCLHAIAR